MSHTCSSLWTHTQGNYWGFFKNEIIYLCTVLKDFRIFFLLKKIKLLSTGPFVLCLKLLSTGPVVLCRAGWTCVLPAGWTRHGWRTPPPTPTPNVALDTWASWTTAPARTWARPGTLSATEWRVREEEKGRWCWQKDVYWIKEKLKMMNRVSEFLKYRKFGLVPSWRSRCCDYFAM